MKYRIVWGYCCWNLDFLRFNFDVCVLCKCVYVGFGFALFAEFFAQLSTSVCALALNSSLMDLVHYTRQGFQRLKQVTKTP